MSKNALIQISIATVSTVAAGLLLDYLKQKQQPQAPVIDNQKSWWEF